MKSLSLALVWLFLLSASLGHSQITGKPIPELSDFDDEMQKYMADNKISAGVLAVSRKGIIIYQRGFGKNYWDQPLPENTPMRIASVEKPLTAAAIRHLANIGALSLNDNVFNLSQANGGILSYQKLPNHSIDKDVQNITVQHLLDHRSGWNESIDPLSGGHFTVAKAAGVCSPPGCDNIARYMLGQKVNGPLPAPFSYLNAGYMLLGLIIEKKSGMSHLDYLQQTLITPDLWVPQTELIFGYSYRKYQNPREPRYNDNCVDSDSMNKVQSCFDEQRNCDPGENPPCCDPGPDVCDPYGGRHQESFVGHGNLVASAAPLLKLLDRYKFHVSLNCGEHLTKPGKYNSDISGLLPGTRAIACQRTDGINIVVLFPNNNSARALKDRIETIISALQKDPSFTWPDQAVDGFWVDFDSTPSGNFYGGHDDPFPTFGTALARVSDGTKLRIKAGSSSWTGVISKRLLIDAPYGKVVIGK